LAPATNAAAVPYHRYLEAAADDSSVTVDLDTVPYESLEQLAAVSHFQPARGTRPALLAVPDLVKLGRASDAALEQPLIAWLQTNSGVFREAIETLRQRRGKTILHENLPIARVGDLSLKVAIEKALGERLVSLSEDFIAFPWDSLADVRRVVTKSGHVIKEVSHRDR
jgi:hypothetical protein